MSNTNTRNRSDGRRADSEGRARTRTVLAAAVLLLAAQAVHAQTAAGNAEAGAIKASQCAGCHGIPGYRNAYPVYHVPKLGGQHAQYIVAALKAYQAGTRQHPTMHAIAASLSEEDMADLAAFFAAEPNGRAQ